MLEDQILDLERSIITKIRKSYLSISQEVISIFMLFVYKSNLSSMLLNHARTLRFAFV
jgi:hypothetical protein